MKCDFESNSSQSSNQDIFYYVYDGNTFFNFQFQNSILKFKVINQHLIDEDNHKDGFWDETDFKKDNYFYLDSSMKLGLFYNNGLYFIKNK